jgi:hypothetical protein
VAAPQSLTEKAGSKIRHIARVRHARPCAGHPRLEAIALEKNVDGRDKPGHDEFVRRLSVLTNDRKSGLHFQSDSQDEGELVDPWFMPKRR